jgi:hypothetical protein
LKARATSESSADISLDAERWALAREWTWEEAEYLLVGLDHWKITRISPDVPLELKDAERRRVREALEFFFRLEDSPQRVSPAQALDVAKRAGIEPPSLLADAVSGVAETLPAISEPSDPPQKGLSRKYHKLLKVLLAIAVEKYGYDPNALRQEAIVRIKQDALAAGIKVDDGTIRSRLLEAVDELDEFEEAAFSSRLGGRSI